MFFRKICLEIIEKEQPDLLDKLYFEITLAASPKIKSKKSKESFLDLKEFQKDYVKAFEESLGDRWQEFLEHCFHRGDFFNTKQFAMLADKKYIDEALLDPNADVRALAKLAIEESEDA